VLVAIARFTSLAFDLASLRDAFDVRAVEGVPSGNRNGAAIFELSSGWHALHVTGELSASDGDRVPIKHGQSQDQFVFRDPPIAYRVLSANLTRVRRLPPRTDWVSPERTRRFPVLHCHPIWCPVLCDRLQRLQRVDWKILSYRLDSEFD